MPTTKVSKLALFGYRITRWEFWPFEVFYFPVFLYYLYLIIKYRSFFFFAASNPTIEFGGMFGEKKSDIFRLLPNKYVPITELIPKGNIDDALSVANRIGYPVVVKPNVGERGVWVEKIINQDALFSYAKVCPADFLIQEYVDYPIELGIFFVKKPGNKGKITSVVRKGFLTISGDGRSSILELLYRNKRALLSADLESAFLQQRGSEVPQKGVSITVEPIGNHSRGTTFYNDNIQIDDQFNQALNQLADQIPKFYYGRFDIKCASYEDLRKLQNFKILELNGAGSEPGHIYQPGYSLIRAYIDVLRHLKILGEISYINKKRGFPYASFKEGYRRWKFHKKYNRMLTK